MVSVVAREENLVRRDHRDQENGEHWELNARRSKSRELREIEGIAQLHFSRELRDKTI